MMKSAVLVAVMAIVTYLIRGLPFLIFRKHTPPYIMYLGKVLPPAIIGMLVVYCLKDVSVTAAPFGLPELIAGVTVVLVHIWRRNTIASILSGTALYMVLLQVMG